MYSYVIAWNSDMFYVPRGVGNAFPNTANHCLPLCVSMLVTHNCVYAVKIVHRSLRVCVIRVSAWTSISYPLIWTLQWRLWHHAWCHNTIACCFDEHPANLAWFHCVNNEAFRGIRSGMLARILYLAISCWRWSASVLAWNYLDILDLL